MINWNNMDTLASYAALKAAEPVKLQAVMAGESGAERVKKYSVPMGCGMDFNFGARPVNDEILGIMADFAKHNVTQLVNTKVQAIEGNTVKALKGEEEIAIECDTVVMAVGSKKNTIDLAGVAVPVVYAGDCSGERTAGIMEAIRGGYHAANNL